jgi:hypothetical protein
MPDAWRSIIALQEEVFEGGLERMRPGATFGELIDFTNSFGHARGMLTRIQLHGHGLGDDGPHINPSWNPDTYGHLRMEQGNAFVWKPIAMSADERRTFIWGGIVVVTESGGERLSTRAHGLVCIS